MNTREINQTEWKSFFDQISKKKGLQFSTAEMNAELFTHATNIWKPLGGITFDPKANCIDIVTEGLDHRIFGPQKVYVQEERGIPLAIEITDRSLMKQIVQLRPEKLVESSVQ